MLTFGWKHALSQEHEADFEKSKKRAFDRPNEGEDARESTGVLKSWLKGSVKNTRSYYQHDMCMMLGGYDDMIVE
ncbi:hypothetical protein E3N88_26542 [Mikania micrantha]|uniref:Uncharacterized protein n=1 Tax=Mikania micrantha TaxID=192012 RepID=A0A5N6MUT3_9ASTR|nr:hypothetical protein E3N88_26542 [Mikania micrantha]